MRTACIGSGNMLYRIWFVLCDMGNPLHVEQPTALLRISIIKIRATPEASASFAASVAETTILLFWCLFPVSGRYRLCRCQSKPVRLKG